eukprot:CCRYP_019386-RA/>CCRYP_019386-RA protein AED:0.48 eAED:0.48 QI:0/0/0/0.5/1/1/2/0/175
MDSSTSSLWLTEDWAGMLITSAAMVVASSSSAAATTTTTANSSSSESTDHKTTTNLNCLMDSGELKKERGITITSKVTLLDYTSTIPSSSDTTTTTIINLVDTPGHAGIMGEVDQILSTVDGIVLVVDAGEGLKNQTKYVLGRALSLELVPIVILNKADRPKVWDDRSVERRNWN